MMTDTARATAEGHRVLPAPGHREYRCREQPCTPVGSRRSGTELLSHGVWGHGTTGGHAKPSLLSVLYYS